MLHYSGDRAEDMDAIRFCSEAGGRGWLSWVVEKIWIFSYFFVSLLCDLFSIFLLFCCSLFKATLFLSFHSPLYSLFLAQFSFNTLSSPPSFTSPSILHHFGIPRLSLFSSFHPSILIAKCLFSLLLHSFSASQTTGGKYVNVSMTKQGMREYCVNMGRLSQHHHRNVCGC